MHGKYIQIIGAQNQPSENLTIYTKGNQPEFSLNLCLTPVSLNALRFPHLWTHALCQSGIPSQPEHAIEANKGRMFEKYTATVHRIPHNRKFRLA